MFGVIFSIRQILTRKTHGEIANNFLRCPSSPSILGWSGTTPVTGKGIGVREAASNTGGRIAEGSIIRPVETWPALTRRPQSWGSVEVVSDDDVDGVEARKPLDIGAHRGRGLPLWGPARRVESRLHRLHRRHFRSVCGLPIRYRGIIGWADILNLHTSALLSSLQELDEDPNLLKGASLAVNY